MGAPPLLHFKIRILEYTRTALGDRFSSFDDVSDALGVCTQNPENCG